MNDVGRPLELQIIDVKSLFLKEKVENCEAIRRSNFSGEGSFIINYKVVT